ncbi:MAG: pseudouridine synthase [Candidatus Acidiferrales bacterium]|jgi:23S rRNA pseudouridine2605 synthase
MLERLQKIIARVGIASRRHAENLIASGLVTVNGQTITELGSKADALRDHIKVSGKLLRPATDRVYLLLNKPPEVVSTMSDPEGRPSLRDFLQGVSERVFPVGRLEYHSTGLVLLTNDGDLANRILQSKELRQTYQLKLKTLLTFAEIENLARMTGARISRLKGKEMPWYEVTLSEARRDGLRSKLFQARHFVEKMKRVGIGNLKLEGLPPGKHREISSAEIATLSRLLDGKETEGPDRPARPNRSARLNLPSRPEWSSRRNGADKRNRSGRPDRPARPGPSSARSGHAGRPDHQHTRPAKAKKPGGPKNFRPHSSPRR